MRDRPVLLLVLTATALAFLTPLNAATGSLTASETPIDVPVAVAGLVIACAVLILAFHPRKKP